MRFLSLVFLLTLSLQIVAQQVIDIPWNVSLHAIPHLNSSAKESNLNLSTDGSELYFFSRRGGMTWSNRDSHEASLRHSDGDIWRSRKENGKWSLPLNLQYANNFFNQDEAQLIGDKLYFQDWTTGWETQDGPYYILDHHNFERKGLSSEICRFFIDNDFHATDGASFSNDGSLFYFTAGTNYQADMNLFFAKKINNKWTYPVLLNISTNNNERTCYITKDNNYLFFASNGYHQRNDLDIYYIALSDPKTIYHPTGAINDTNNNCGFIISSIDCSAYCVIDEDIYHVQFNTNKPSFCQTLHERKEIIHFETAKHTPLNNELKQLLLNVLPLKHQLSAVRIAAHTDKVGNSDYNEQLARRRAAEIKTILIKNGVRETIITTNSFGENRPLINTPTAEITNRRCEITLIYTATPALSE